VVCGLPKTCTTTFMEVFRILGIKTHDNCPKCLPEEMNLNNNIVWNCDDNLDNSNMKFYDGFHDPPYSLNYKSFYEKYPNSKFILSVRNPEKWFQSLKKYSKAEYYDYVAFPKKLLKYLFGRDEVLEKDKDHFIKKYNEYNNKVIEFFKSKNKEILVINVAENNSVKNWELVLKYLEVDENLYDKLIKQPFPHKNKQ
jgi:hypothetical protein